MNRRIGSAIGGTVVAAVSAGALLLLASNAAADSIVSRADLSPVTAEIVDLAGIALPVDVRELENAYGAVTEDLTAKIWDFDPDCTADRIARLLPDPDTLVIEDDAERTRVTRLINEIRLADHALRMMEFAKTGPFGAGTAALAAYRDPAGGTSGDPVVANLFKVQMLRQACARTSSEMSELHATLWYFMVHTSNRLGVVAGDPANYVEVLTRTAIAGQKGMANGRRRVDPDCIADWAKGISSRDLSFREGPLPELMLLSARLDELFVTAERTEAEEREYDALKSVMTQYQDWTRDSAVAALEARRAEASGLAAACALD